jgi:hypothetical protein
MRNVIHLFGEFMDPPFHRVGNIRIALERLGNRGAADVQFSSDFGLIDDRH